MRIVEYRQAALTFVTPRTMVLCTRDRNYLSMGLMGESGEVAEHLKKMLRDDDGVLTAARATALRSELGDVLWYAAMWMRFYMNDIQLWWMGETFDDFFREVSEGEGIYSPNDPFTAARNIAKEVSRLHAEDDDIPPRCCMMRLLYNIGFIAEWAHGSLDSIAVQNIAKLKDRQERGVLHGSGSKR